MSKRELRNIITEADVGNRLDRFVVDFLQSEGLIPKEHKAFFSRTLVASSLQEFVTLAKRPLKPGYKLRINDEVTIDPDKFIEVLEGLTEDRVRMDRIEPEKGELDIVEENEHFLVLNKPSGVVIHPGIGNVDGTLANWVKYYLQEKGEYDDQVERAGIVHRLDKGVSGLVVIAKTIEAQKELKKLFEEHKVVKIYHAQVKKLRGTEYGKLFREAGENLVDLEAEIEALKDVDYDAEARGWTMVGGYIKRDPVGRRRMLLGEEGKQSITYIKAISKGECLIKIETGRMHQIRATLNKMGYVILGDQMYGDRSSSDSDQIKLRAILLKFELLGEEYSFSA